MELAQKPNSTDEQHARPDAHAHPEDPETNTRPPGNGEREQPDATRAEEKLEEVSGH
jgi:hypothetical protein